MINDAIIRRVKYPPELIPDCFLGNVPLNAEVVTPILDLKRFSPYLLALTNIQLAANANVVLRARYDEVRIEENTAAMLMDLAGASRVGAWNLFARSILYYNLFGVTAAPVANYTSHYGVSVLVPTVAHKVLYDIPLTPVEQAICSELNIKNSVEKGILPLPISQQIEREYRVIGEETHSRSVNIAAANTVYTIEVLNPRYPNDEFIVLTRMASAPGAVGNDIRFIVDRDDDLNFAQLQTVALTLNAGGEASCFIPAMREIRLTTTSVGVPGAHLFRYTIQRVKLSNLLKVRFGLVSEDEAVADTWKKVKGGIL